MAEGGSSRQRRPRYEMPEQVRRALTSHGLMDAYRARPAYQQNDYIGWIVRAKRPETAQKRLAQMLDELAGGGIYMKMIWKKGVQPGQGAPRISRARATQDRPTPIPRGKRLMIDLDRPHPSPKTLAAAAAKNPVLMQELLDGVAPETRKAARRENCSKALMQLAETQPRALVPHWAYFVSLLGSGNGFSQYVAVYAVAAIAVVEKKGLFARAFGRYFGVLDGESLMVAAHAIANSARIAQAQPVLQARILQRLAAIDKTHFDAGRKELLKGYAVTALDGFYDKSAIQPKILAYVKAQTASKNAKTRKLAKDFLKRRGLEE